VHRDDVGPVSDVRQDLDLAPEPVLLDGPHDFYDAALVAGQLAALVHLPVLALPNLLHDLVVILFAPVFVCIRGGKLCDVLKG